MNSSRVRGAALKAPAAQGGTTGVSRSSLQGAGCKLLVAALSAAALHLGQSYIGQSASFQWLSAWLGSWLGPSLVAALALALYPRATTSSSAAAPGAAALTERPIPASYPLLDSLAEACEQANAAGATAPRGAGLLKRLTRKLSRRLTSGKDEAALHVEVPFFRRTKRSPSFGRSPRGSSEGLSSRWGQEHRSTGRRQQGMGLARQGSGSMSMSEAMTQDAMSSHAAMSNNARSSKGEWAASDTFVYTGHLAVDCLPYDTTETVNEEVKQVVTELHLLQFGMLLGESSAELAIGMQGAAQPVGPTPDSMFGEVDCPEQFQRGWERIIEEHKEGLHYWVSRRHLRKGLYMYKSRTVYEDATPEQMVAFTFTDCDSRRILWDEGAAALEPIAPPSRPDMTLDHVLAAARSQSTFMYARTRFPPPMAQREYMYARRIWYKADDGGCYCINKACAHPAPPAAGCRTTRVTDFSSGFVIRAVPGIYSTAPAVEVSTVYFEDSCAHAGIINIAVRKAMWPMTQKSEKGLRRYILNHAGGLPERRSPPFAPAPDTSAAATSICAPPSVDSSASGASEQTHELSTAGQQEIAAVQPPAAEKATEVGSSSDVFGAGSAIRNASMFSGYYPALTRRLHFTPILYTCYLGAWRSAAAAIRGLLASSKLSWRLFCCWHRAMLSSVARSVAWLVARQQERAARRSPGGVKSYPLALGKGQPGSQGAARTSTSGAFSLSLRRQGLGRRLSQLATVAAKAAGLPLVHCLLNGRFSSRAPAPGLQRPPRPPAYKAGALDSSSAVISSSASAQSQPRSGRYVRPVVVDGVVVGHCPPKPPRQQLKARTLMQVMFGLRAPDDGLHARQEHAPLRRQPLSRRIM